MKPGCLLGETWIIISFDNKMKALGYKGLMTEMQATSERTNLSDWKPD
jgi:hypothetical protein